MTAYEHWSLIFSATALALSILIPVFKLVFSKSRRSKIAIIPFDGYPVTLHFDAGGASLDFKFSLSCSKKDCVVRSLQASIEKNSGTATSFDWDILKPINLNWANAGIQQIQLNAAELVHPLLLKKDSLTPLNVHFTREDPAWSALIPAKGSHKKANSIARTHPLSDQISDMLLWKEGDFSLTIKAIYDTGRELSATFQFSVNAEQAKKLQENSFLIASTDPAIRMSTNPYFAMVRLNKPTKW